MFYIYGQRLYGKIEATQGCFVVTQCVHLNFLPLFPTRSVMVVQSPGEPAPSYLSIPMSGTSVMAAYFRTWGVLVSVVSTIATLVAFSHDDGELAYAVLSGVLVASTAWSFLRLGKLSQAAHAQRAIYAQFASAPVDIARLAPTMTGLRTHLVGLLASEAPALSALGSYRAPVDTSDWRAVALDPSVTHPVFLRAALTLARLEASNAPRAAQRELTQTHDAIWEKLVKLEGPEVGATAAH